MNEVLTSDRPASDGLANAAVVDKPQNCFDESAVSKGTVGSNGHAVSTLEASDSDASASVEDEELSTNGDCRDPGGASSKSAETNSDESIISTADLRDVFNRLEVIVQKLARGGAVW